MMKKKSLHEVETCAHTLQSMLQANEHSMPVIYKFAWTYPAKSLYTIAGEAIANNTHKSPVPLFVWLVKEKLGYQPKPKQKKYAKIHQTLNQDMVDRINREP